MSFTSLLLFVTSIVGVLANFELSLDSSKYDVSSDSLTISWQDDGTSPNTDTFVTANFLLCTYTTASDFNCPITLKEDVDISSASKETFSLSSFAAAGGDGEYTVQMTAIQSSASNYVIMYTSWVALSSMTGSQSALQGPVNNQNNINSANTFFSSYTVPTSYQNLASPWMTPYTWQKGATRYAPFQSTPGSKVTAPLSSATRRFPTSSYSAFLSNINTMLPVTTQTPSPSVTPPQYAHVDNSITVAYTGVQPSRVIPTVAARRRRWAD